MERVADRLLELVQVQLLMEVFPDLLSIMVSAGEKMIHSLIFGATRGACAHLRRRGCLVTIV